MNINGLTGKEMKQFQELLLKAATVQLWVLEQSLMNEIYKRNGLKTEGVEKQWKNKK